MIDLEKERLQKELRERTYGYISAVFGLATSYFLKTSENKSV